MPKFYVSMLIEFAGEIEADSEDHAERLAWDSWGDTMDNPITFVNVDEIKVEEMEDEDEE